MQKVQKNKDAPNEELVDTLIAISVVAKRIAGKLRMSGKKGEQTDVKDERTVGST